MAERDAAPGPEENEITDETSKRICAHMNSDHTLSVYAMAKRKIELPGRNWKISDVFLKKVTMEGCSIQVILCRDILCHDVNLTYPFEPPLTHPSQIRSRIIAIHHEVCTPHSVYKHPVFPLVVLLFASLGWGTLGMGTDGLARSFARAVHVGFYFTLLGHTVLATGIAYLCRKELKLSMRTTTEWYAAVSLSGLLAVQEFLELLEVDRKCKYAKKKKAS
jgi:Protein of unknown function (DUF2470)